LLSDENVTIKRTINRNIHIKKKEYKCRVKEHIKKLSKLSDSEIISIDETHFDNYINKNYGWGVKGKRIKRETYLKYNTKYSVICAISNKKILNYKIVKGSVNGEIFNNFMMETIRKNNLENKHLLLDNARIHHTKKLKESIKATTNKLFYNVPYTPELNPIEILFSKIKKDTKDKRNIKRENLKINIRKSFKKIKSNYLTKIYSKMRQYK